MKNCKYLNFQTAIVVACVVLSVSFAVGGLLLETQIVTGKISTLNNNEIKLESGQQFLPAPAIQGSSFQKGDTVTLRYYVNTDGKNIYIEIAGGANTLPENPNPPPLPGGIKR